MLTFVYSAAKKTGEIEKGEREAENQQTLARALKQEGLFLVEAREKGSGNVSTAGLNINLDDYIAYITPIKLVDKMFFARNLAVMVEAGLSLTRALDALAEQASNKRFKKIIRDLDHSVTQGTSFSDSLRPHEKVFGSLFVNMVAVGEVTGKLTLVLKLLGNQMRKDNDLKKRVAEHNAGLSFATRYRRPLVLIYYEAYLDWSDAKKREKYLKGGNGRKQIKIQLKSILSKVNYKNL